MAEQKRIDEFVMAAHGEVEKVKAMLSEDPDLLNANATWNETALMAACQMALTPLVEHLLELGAPMDIFAASALGQTAQVAVLLDQSPELIHARGAHGIPLLYYPVAAGQLAVARLLAERGADVNAGEGGITALHGAALFGRTECAAWLLECGAKPNVRTKQGKTPLDMARSGEHTAVVQILLQHGAAEPEEPLNP